MKKIVAVDIDGVLVDNSRSEWKGPDIIADPVPGAREFLEELAGLAHVLIFTSRVNERNVHDMPGIIKEWLDRHQLTYDGIWSGIGKPSYMAVVDDRAVSCRPADRGYGDFSRAVEAVRELLAS